MKVRGNEIPKNRNSRASNVVNGIAALDSAPHKNKFKVKNIPKIIPDTRNDVINMLVFQRSPPITTQERYIHIYNCVLIYEKGLFPAK